MATAMAEIVVIAGWWQRTVGCEDCVVSLGSNRNVNMFGHHRHTGLGWLPSQLHAVGQGRYQRSPHCGCGLCICVTGLTCCILVAHVEA